MTPRERITFEKATEEKAVCGEINKKFVPLLLNVPAERRKQSAEGDGMNANEEFTGIKIVFWVRYHPLINEDLRVVYAGKPYKILDVKRQYYDNSYLITCIKIND